MDTSKQCAITVSIVDGGIIKFKECEEGIYYYGNETNNNKKQISKYSVLTNVYTNKQYLVSQKIEGASNTRRLQQKLDFPK